MGVKWFRSEGVFLHMGKMMQELSARAGKMV